jgi:hypothetical protein
MIVRTRHLRRASEFSVNFDEPALTRSARGAIWDRYVGGQDDLGRVILGDYAPRGPAE